MVNFKNPFFIIFVTTGLVLVITRFIMDKFPPKKINNLYGYRTKRSMKSQEAWDFAQSYSADLLGNTGAIMGIIGILIGFLNFKESTLNVVLALIFMLLFMFYPVYKTEQKLKSKFK